MKNSDTPTFEQRVSAVEQLGYTRREAEFLVLAALHSGYFLRRQFSAPGKADHALCRKLMATGHGKLAHTTGQTQVYHICGKPLFRTLGQEDNRHRRNHESFYIRSKIMLLDYVLETKQGPQFLATEEDKVEYFCHVRGLNRSVLPSKKYLGRDGSTTTRYFVDKFPVRVDPGGTVSFGYIDDGLSKAGFRTWLTQIRPLAEALGRVEMVFISSSVNAMDPARKEFARRFSGVDEPLEAYFRMRQAIESDGLGGRSQEALDRYRSWQRQYAGDAYEQRYAAWKNPESSVPKASAVMLTTQALPYRYGIFGEIASAEDSNVGMRDGSDEVEGGCVCFVATGDEKFVRIGFSPRMIRRFSDIRRLDLAAVQQTSEPVKMLGYMPGTPATERWLHRKFAAEYHAKKWFRASEKLRGFLAAAELSEIRVRGGNVSQ
jgi:hypothetical protein